MKVICGILVALLIGSGAWGYRENDAMQALKQSLNGKQSELLESQKMSDEKDATIGILTTKLDEAARKIAEATGQLQKSRTESESVKTQLSALQSQQNEQEQKARLIASIPEYTVVAYDGRVIAKGAYYQRTFGRKVIFKQGENLLTYDVSELHPGLLMKFKIDPDVAIAEQSRIDQTSELQDKQVQSDRAYMLRRQKEAAIALAQREFEMQKQEAINQRQRFEDQLKIDANATERIKANAAMIQAQNPTQIIQQQNTLYGR